jgi:hypothetical protein
MLEDNGKDRGKSYLKLARRCAYLHNKDNFLSSVKEPIFFSFSALVCDCERSLPSCLGQPYHIQNEGNTED